jgi:hypothetical protein
VQEVVDARWWRICGLVSFRDEDPDTFAQRKVVVVQVPNEHAQLTVGNRLLLTPITCVDNVVTNVASFRRLESSALVHECFVWQV